MRRELGAQVLDELRRREGRRVPAVGEDEPPRLAQRLGGQLEDRLAAAAGLDLLLRVPDHLADLVGDLGRRSARGTGRPGLFPRTTRRCSERTSRRRSPSESRSGRPVSFGALDAREVEVLHEALRLVLGEDHPVAPGEDERVRTDDARIAGALARLVVADRERDALLQRLGDGLPGFLAHGAERGVAQRRASRAPPPGAAGRPEASAARGARSRSAGCARSACRRAARAPGRRRRSRRGPGRRPAETGARSRRVRRRSRSPRGETRSAPRARRAGSRCRAERSSSRRRARPRASSCWDAGLP